MKFDIQNKTADEFWQELYKKSSTETSGRPSAILEQFAKDLSPKSALDLGCAKGDDVVWLAKQGWNALGVDIASTAIEIAKGNAERNGMAERARFERHDLAISFPEGEFDLISVMFLQTPYSLTLGNVLNRATRSLRKGGLLLSATHQKVAPWSWGDPNATMPDANERYTEIKLNPNDWRQIYVGPIERIASGSNGQTASVVDAVVAIERL